MPTHILDLPVHPLAVHLPVVLVPLLALLTAGYVLVPRLRSRLGWAVIALSLAAPPAAFVARWSGQRLAAEKMAELRDSPDAAVDFANAANGHSRYGDVLVWLVLAIAPLAWLFAGLASRRLDRFARARSLGRLSAVLGTEEAPKRWRAPFVAVLGVLLVALSAASAWYVVQAGHTGAAMLWSS